MRLLVAAFVLALAPAARAAPPVNFDARVESLRQTLGVPGVAVSIVENGEVTLARGYGIKRIGRSDPVGPDTILPTGSTGKAFTVAALATLVDQGRIGWDDKVIDHLPWFQMYDPWVTREMTIRDLLVHRSGLGLGAGDLLFVPRSARSRKDSVKALRHIRPATSFRSGYAYDNVLYMVAGELIEAVTGKTWERYVADHILRPAGMRSSTTSDADRYAAPDRAQPHARLNGPIRGAGDQEVLDERNEAGANAAPAGGLAISANDMARWLQIQLAQGRLPEGNGRLYSEAAAAEMWKPVVIQPIAPRPEALKALEPMFYTYALGWDVQDYRGAKIVWHGGAVFGFLSAVVLIPEKNVGFAIEINSEDGEMVRGLMHELLDHYLGLPHAAWPEKLRDHKRQQLEKAVAALSSPAAKPARVGPSLPLARYAGTYRDPWYGRIAVRAKDGRLHIDFLETPRMEGTLEHWQYDTFRTRLTDRSIEPAYVTFGLDADGRIERVTMKPVSPLADFSYDYQDLLFTPEAPSQ